MDVIRVIRVGKLFRVLALFASAVARTFFHTRQPTRETMRETRISSFTRCLTFTIRESTFGRVGQC